MISAGTNAEEEEEEILMNKINNVNERENHLLLNDNTIDNSKDKEEETKNINDKESRDLSFINPDLYGRIQNTITLQNILLNITEIEIDESAKSIESLGFFSTEHNFSLFIRNTAFMSIFRPLYIIQFAKLIKNILDELEPTEKGVMRTPKTHKYHFITLNELFHYIYVSDEVNCFNSFLHLTFHLYKEGTFTANEVVDFIRKCFKRYSLSRSAISSIYAVFSPEIDHIDHDTSERTLNFIKTWVSEKILNPKACHFYENFDHYRSNDYKHLKDMRETITCQFPYFDIFINDDVDRLRELSSSPEFSVDSPIESPYLSPFYFLASDYSLLSCSASFGAVECFNYLIQKGANYDNRKNSTQVAQYAMIGGSIEIIRICEQFNMSFEGTLQSSATFFRNEIFEYIYETRNRNLMEVSPTKAIVILQAATSNNLELMLHCLEMNCDVNQRDEYEMNCLKKAAYFGLSEMIELLLSIPEIEMNQGELGFAASNGHFDSCNLIIQKVKESGVKYNINYVGITGKPPLFDAIVHSHFKCMDLIYRNGGDVNFVTEDKYSIHHFIASQNNVKILDYFKNKVIFNINLKTRMLLSPLILCVMNMSTDMLDYLLENYRNDIDQLNLFFAIRLMIYKGNVCMIKLFLKYPEYKNLIIQAVQNSDNNDLIKFINENFN